LCLFAKKKGAQTPKVAGKMYYPIIRRKFIRAKGREKKARQKKAQTSCGEKVQEARDKKRGFATSKKKGFRGKKEKVELAQGWSRPTRGEKMRRP